MADIHESCNQGIRQYVIKISLLQEIATVLRKQVDCIFFWVSQRTGTVWSIQITLPPFYLH